MFFNAGRQTTLFAMGLVPPPPQEDGLRRLTPPLPPPPRRASTVAEAFQEGERGRDIVPTSLSLRAAVLHMRGASTGPQVPELWIGPPP